MKLTKEILEELYYTVQLTQAEISKKLNVSRGKIEYAFKKYNIKGRKTKYTFDESKLSENYLEMWYFLGIFAADGWMSKNSKSYNVHLNLSTKGGEELVKNIAKFFNYNGKIYYYKNKGARLTITSTKFGVWLNNHAIPLKNKTYDLDISNLDFKSEKNFRNFMRGFFDGDGCLSIKQLKNGNFTPRYIRILTANEKTIKTMIEKTNYYLGNISKYNNPRGYHEFEILKNNDIIKFLDWIYKDKKQKLKLKGKYYLYKIIKMMI